MKRYHFVFDKGKTNKKIKKILLKKFNNFDPNISNVIVVLGGDGFMLQVLKKYQKYKKPFYGINTGTFGFLMNKYKNQDLDKIISKTKLISISPLEMKVLTKTGKKFRAIAINEISLLRQSRQTASLRIMDNNKIVVFFGGGALMCSLINALIKNNYKRIFVFTSKRHFNEIHLSWIRKSIRKEQ